MNVYKQRTRRLVQLLDSPNELQQAKTMERKRERSIYVHSAMLPATGLFQSIKESEGGTLTNPCTMAVVEMS
jgi:hypothetical protein